MGIPAFCICKKNADQVGCTVAAQLISSFVFTTKIVQSLYFLYPKFPASCHLMWLYSLVCVGPGRHPKDRFSHDAAHIWFIMDNPMGELENILMMIRQIRDDPIGELENYLE